MDLCIGIVLLGIGVFLGSVAMYSTMLSSESKTEVESRERMNRALKASLVAQQREALLFDGWRSARTMALAMGNIADRAVHCLCDISASKKECLDTIKTFQQIEPEYLAWIATTTELRNRVEAVSTDSFDLRKTGEKKIDQ